MPQSTYDEEILEILRLNGGKILGFNTLKNKRTPKPFHGNELKLATERLERKDLINVKTVGKRGDKEYNLIDHNIEKAYDLFIGKMQEMEHQLYNPNLKKDEKRVLHRNYMIVALHNLDLLRFFRYAKDAYKRQGKPVSLKKIESLEARLDTDIQKKLGSLDEDERSRLLNLMMPKEPNLLTLEDYRRYTHKATAQEKREEKLQLKQRLIENHANSPFCSHCGKKTRDYTEKDKHDEKHLKELVAMGLPWFIKKYGVGYNENTGKPRKDKKLEKVLSSL